VNMVMNLWVPLEASNFLTGWAILSLSRKTLAHGVSMKAVSAHVTTSVRWSMRRFVCEHPVVDCFCSHVHRSLPFKCHDSGERQIRLQATVQWHWVSLATSSTWFGGSFWFRVAGACTKSCRPNLILVRCM
jgi:hypothetical protein